VDIIDNWIIQLLLRNAKFPKLKQQRVLKACFTIFLIGLTEAVAELGRNMSSYF